MQQFSSLLSWHLFTAQHVSVVLPPIIRSSMTAVAASSFPSVIEFLMMGGRTPETCWAVNTRHDNKLKNCCSWLVNYLNYNMYKYFTLWKSQISTHKIQLLKKLKICEKYYVPKNTLKETVTFVWMIWRYDFHVLMGGVGSHDSH
jgi:hypothetical protein